MSQIQYLDGVPNSLVVFRYETPGTFEGGYMDVGKRLLIASEETMSGEITPDLARKVIAVHFGKGFKFGITKDGQHAAVYKATKPNITAIGMIHLGRAAMVNVNDLIDEDPDES